MSRFYSNYRKNHTTYNDSVVILNEEHEREVHKEHIRQANMTTRGKHTGSKSKERLLFNIHRGQRMIQGIMSGYAE